ncbi:MAG: cytidylate kinase-like family protein [Gemmataceae bacterium]|nr:cytidylate kinase-like family protein [Gemmataceae bacterium]
MPEQHTPFAEDPVLPPFPETPVPLHGFRGPAPEVSPLPRALTIAISREAGARGGTIAKRAAEKLGWQVFSQDLIEYISQEGAFRQEFLNDLPAAATPWVDGQLQQLLKDQNLSRNPTIVELARIVLSLGAQGEVILLGRGAGCILPARSTLHVRFVAPLEDRIAYMGQWLRLTHDEAAEQVRKRDLRRADFVSTHFHRRPSDVHQYDLVLNSSALGEETCADLVVHAAKAKQAALTAAGHEDGAA